MEKKQLLLKAQKGDQIALEILLGQFRPKLFHFLNQLLAESSIADDLCQEILFIAFQEISQVPLEEDFEFWMLKIAWKSIELHENPKGPWSPNALDILEEHLIEEKQSEQKLLDIYEGFEENYTISDHINFCFTVLLQSLYFEERAVFILQEIWDFPAEKVSQLTRLDIKKSEKHFQDALDHLTDTFFERCSLIQKQAPCTQCQNFGNWLIGDKKTQKQLETLDFDQSQGPEANFETRLEIIKNSLKIKESSPKLHQALMGLLRNALGN